MNCARDQLDTDLTNDIRDMEKQVSMCRLALVIVLLGTYSASSRANPEQSDRRAFFESKIRPVLIKHCYDCHSVASDESKGGLLLDSRAGWQVGGDSGPAIVPNKPDESLIIHAISRSGEASEMPPTSHLPDQIVSDFETWIADGAFDPREGKAPVREDETIDIAAGKKFWSFRPRREFTEEPSIDGLVNPRAPIAAADKLVRRLFLDLIGLPPNLMERQEFTRLYHERSPGEAVDTFANQLLARTAFGEKWARHWLDVARYADSNGGDFNLTFPQAWRYRNYVIDAFNSDLPYDQFLREQIAGDLLPFDSPAQRNRQLIATGFLMVAPKMLTERNKAKMHLDIADEQVDTIGRAIMGLTLGCARCHDHKFDPIPTADYYAMAGILHSTRTADRILMGNVNVTGWTETDLVMDSENRELVDAHQARLEKLQNAIRQHKQQKAKPRDAQITEKLARSPNSSDDVALKALEDELKKLQGNTPEIPQAMAAQDNSNERLGDLHIRIRGETTNLGAIAPRGFLQVVSGAGSSTAKIPEGTSGRLELAQWLTRADHPLTSRVMVNRIWQQFFGRGIVATSDNFGVRGARPSHPELLDYLAERFVANGWSTKFLIREIIDSKTYQQAAQTAAEDDPDNLQLRCQNRRPAPAETIRDSILAIAGELDRTPRDSVVELLGMYAIETSGKRHPSLGQSETLRQRSIYMPIVRGAIPPSLAVFDVPNPDLVTGKRAVTTVPAQALFMMNSPFVREMAQAVSWQVTQTDLSAEEITQQLYQRVLIRDADSDDIMMATDYIDRRMNADGKSQQAAVASLVQALFSSTEFRFIE